MSGGKLNLSPSTLCSGSAGDDEEPRPREGPPEGRIPEKHNLWREAGSEKLRIIFIPDLPGCLPAYLMRMYETNRSRVFIKFLSLWTRYGGPTIAAKVEVTQHDLRLTLNSPLGRKQASKRGCSAKAAAERAASRTSSSSSCKKRAGRPPKCCTAATAMLGDALSLFTRLLVLCRRCRRPCTALFAGEDSGPSRHRRGPSPDLRGSRTGRVVGGKTTTVVAPGSSRCRRGGVALWIECQGEGCGVTSWVGVAAANGGGGGGGTDPPPWLAKFSRFVLNRAWKVRYTSIYI